MFTIPYHNGKWNDKTTAAAAAAPQSHASFLLIVTSVCVVAILNLGDHSTIVYYQTA